MLALRNRSVINMEKFKGKKIAILGFGVEGKSILDFFLGKNLDITVFDRKEQSKFESEEIKKYKDNGIKFVFGETDNLDTFDYIFRSPGIHPNTKTLKRAKEKGVQITSATKLFFDLCKAKIVGVTGTKGKGTTSTLIYEILKKEGKDVFLGGNIGNSPLSFLESLKNDSIVVLELSSFQLIDLEKSPNVSVILMTTSEHLDYHRDVYEYIEAKRNILRHQKEGDCAVVNRDYPASNESDVHSNGKVYKVSREQEVEQGCFIRDDKIVLKMNDHEEEILNIKEVYLPGRHNLENVCAAIVASLCAGATMKSIIPVVKTFKGLPHRIELVATVNGVSYYDDSFSTAPETAIAAIESFEEPKILILGGSSKNSDFAELGKVISESDSIRAIIGIGKEWKRIKPHILTNKPTIIEETGNMAQIVKKAQEMAEIGDVVLLSPACASFGMFKNYKDRGDQFKKEVNSLKN